MDYFKELAICNRHTEKTKIKRLKDNDLLFQTPFYEELDVIKTNYPFRRYAMIYKVELVEKKDPIQQL